MFTNWRSHVCFNDEKMNKVSLVDTPRMFADLYCLRPGQAQKVHAHSESDKVYLVLQGNPVLVLGEEEQRLGEGEMAYAAPGVPHGVRNDSDDDAVCLVWMTPRPVTKKA